MAIVIILLIVNLLLTTRLVWELRSSPPSRPPSPVLGEVKAAFGDCGLPLDQFSPDFDLLHSGKLHEVLVHASRRLGNPLVTVDDLRKLLE